MIRFFASLFSNLSLAGLVFFGADRCVGADLQRGSAQYRRPAQLRAADAQSRVFAGEGQLIAEFARERRIFVPVDEVPDLVKQAFISAEDKNFYKHQGVDGLGIVKAMFRFAQGACTGSGERLSGASTITQQVDEELPRRRRPRPSSARSRKRSSPSASNSVFTKDQILELYLNDPFLGARSLWAGRRSRELLRQNRGRSRGSRRRPISRRCQRPPRPITRSATATAPLVAATMCSSGWP